jgi:purine-nucleoside phosphorylase
MLYIITALKPEAQAFIDRYRLQKRKLGDFYIFTSKEIRLIVSGLGVQNATLATQTLINHFDITDDDIYINVGICGANKKHKIGELLRIGAINYKNKTYTINQESTTAITCLDEEASEEKYEIVDMESFGFYDAVFHSPAIKNLSIFKVVSDHFEPHKVTKDGTKSLIFNAIDAINNIIKTKA